MSQDILLKVVIDGKEATVSLAEINEGIEGVKTNVPGLGDEFAKTYKNITKELIKHSAVTEESTESLAEWIRTQNLSVEIIEDSIHELTNETKVLGINTEEWKQKSAALTNLKNAYGKAITGNRQIAQSSKPAVAGANKMNLAFNQMGYVVNDASVFMLDFRMGMMGVANNIPMVVNFLKDAKYEIAETGGTMRSALTSAIMGPGGLMIAINGLMLLLMVLPDLFGDTSEEIKNQADEVKNLRDEYDKLSVAEKERELGKLNAEKKKLEADKENLLKKRTVTYQDGGFKKTISVVNYKGISESDYEDQLDEIESKAEELEKKIKPLLDSIAIGNNQLALIKEGKFDLSTINKVKDAIELLNKEFENVRGDDKREEISKQIDELEKLKKRMSGDESSTKEFKKRDAELELTHEHISNMAKLEGINADESLKLRAKHLQERIQLHKDYNQSTTELENELIEVQKELQNTAVTKQREVIKSYYEDVKFDDENYLQYRIKLIEDEAKKMKESAGTKVNVELWKATEINKLTKEQADYFKKLTAEEVKEAKKAAREKVKAIEDYYSVLRFEDESYFEYESVKIEQSTQNLIAMGLSEVDAEAYKLNLMKQLDEEYFDWKWNKLTEDYNFLFRTLGSMEAAYDTFWDTILDKDITGTQRWILMRDSMYQTFITMLGDMLKNYVTNLIMSAAIGDTLRAAEVVKGTATGTALANAYAPAAAFASTMTFGGAAAAGSAGLIGTVALAQTLANLKIPGYEKGGAIVGEKGVEIIAPAKDFASGMDQLVLQTISAIEKDLKSNSHQSFSGSDYSEKLTKALDRIEVLLDKQSEFSSKVVESDALIKNSGLISETLNKIDKYIENPPPSRAYLDDRQAKEIVKRGGAQIRKLNL